MNENLQLYFWRTWKREKKKKKGIRVQNDQNYSALRKIYLH